MVVDSPRVTGRADEPANEAQRRVLLRLPVRIGLFPLRYWTVAAVCSALGRALFGSDVGCRTPISTPASALRPVTPSPVTSVRSVDWSTR